MRSRSSCWSARTAGSRRSTMVIARARARTSPARNLSARSDSLVTLSRLQGVPADAEVVAEHHHEPIGLLAARGRVIGRRGGDDRGVEVRGPPLGGFGGLAAGVVEDDGLGRV